jgi:hypothetical protein
VQRLRQAVGDIVGQILARQDKAPRALIGAVWFG